MLLNKKFGIMQEAVVVRMRKPNAGEIFVMTFSAADSERLIIEHGMEFVDEYVAPEGDVPDGMESALAPVYGRFLDRVVGYVVEYVPEMHESVEVDE